MTDKSARPWPANPFSPGATLDPSWVTGRSAESAQLLKALRDNWTRVLVRGPRGIGKTTFVKKVIDQGKGDSVYVDLREYIRSAEMSQSYAVIQRLVRALINEIEFTKGLPLNIVAARAGEQDLLRRILPEICSQSEARFSIIVDELDYVDTKVLQDVIRFTGRTSTLPNAPLWILILGEAWGAPFKDRVAVDSVQELTLGLLKSHDVFDLLERYRTAIFPFQNDATELISEVTAGHPLFIAALLDALYDARWQAADRSPISRSDVDHAIDHFERKPTDRITHALRQGGPAVQRVLRTLADAGREALTNIELDEIFRREWPGWVQEIPEAVRGLTATCLLVYEDGRWSHRIPMLRRYFANVDRSELETEDRPPRPDAWNAFTKAQSLELEGDWSGAATTYREAIDCDAAFWLPRWHLAKLLTELAGTKDESYRSASLLEEAKYHLGVVEADVAGRSTAHAELLHGLLAKTLVALAQPLRPTDARRIAFIAELRKYDPFFTADGASDLAAESVVATWFQELWADTPMRDCRESVRRLLKDQPGLGTVYLWRAFVEQLIITTNDDTTSPDRALQVLRYLVPVLLEEQLSVCDASHLWAEMRRWVRLAGDVALQQTDRWLPAQTWDAILAAAPDGTAARLFDVLRNWFDHDLQVELATPFGDGATLVRAVLNPRLTQMLGEHQSQSIVKTVLANIESIVLMACGDGAIRKTIVTGLADVLLALRNHERIQSEDLDTLVDMYVRSWGATTESVLPLPEHAFRAWQSLLGKSTHEAQFLQRFRSERELGEPALEPSEKSLVAGWLNGVYEVLERVPVRLPGLSSDELKQVVRAYVARPEEEAKRSERVLIRTFRFRSPDTATNELMRSIWDRERRALATLGLSPARRSLLGFRDARRDDEANVGILVTDWVGSRTLRDVVNEHSQSIRQRWGRQPFWRQFAALLEAVEAIHRAKFLHRSISPEAIYVTTSVSDASPHAAYDLGLRLCHFEGSIYLRGLSVLGEFRRQLLTRYVAPEALRAAFGIARGHSGEGFSSDLYALGLTLFECCIRRIELHELAEYPSDAAYSEDAERAHEDWLKSLHVEVGVALTKQRIDKREAQLLEQLLQFDVANRPTNLAELLPIARQLAFVETVDFGRPFPVATMLAARAEYDNGPLRADPRCIAYFLRNELPGLTDATRVDSLDDLVREDLRGASLYLNRNRAHYPLLMRSRTGILYRLAPLTWDGTVHTDIALLQVARRYEGDEPFGEPLGVLQAGVTILDIARHSATVTAYIAGRRKTDASWSALFAVADERGLSVDADNRDRERRQKLLDVLAISTEVEYQSAWTEEPFVRVSDDSTMVRGIEDANLAVTVAGWLERDVVVEVASARDAAGSGIEIGLRLDAIDVDAGTVDLRDADSPIPSTGVLRPSANRGIAALYRRRRQVLQQLRSDNVLLNTIVSPEEATVDLQCDALTEADLFLDSIDNDKLNILNRFRTFRPLVVVQGPPGTGKTTFATEVLLQTLSENVNSRILVAAQGHGPLDNVLERLLRERRTHRAAELLEELELVRIASGNRVEREYPDEVRPYLPFVRAERLFRQLLTEAKKNSGHFGLHGLVARAIEHELAGYFSAPQSLMRRIVDGANLVFLTTNAREIETAVPGSFDLVIVEEAARCVPIELLSAMRLSRRWLLIGDHRQLAPYGFEQVVKDVKTRLAELQQEFEWRRRADAAASTASSGEETSASEAERRRLAALGTAVDQYMRLFQELHENGGDVVATTLKTQWRMHPTLGSVVGDVFYDGKSVVNPNDSEDLARKRVHPFSLPEIVRGTQLLWIDFDLAAKDPSCFEQRGAGGEISNTAERRAAVAFLRSLRAPRRVDDIAILSPYRGQVERLRKAFADNPKWFEAMKPLHERVFTVDSFQGRQAGTVILSLVRNNTAADLRSAVGFLANRQRCTVMFSRAERLLVVMGCSALYSQFAETDWIMRIFDRAKRVHWRDVLTLPERAMHERR